MASAGSNRPRGIGFKIEPHATDARARHLLERLARGSLVDDGNAAGPRAHAAHSVEGAGIVGAIDARLHDHDAIEVKVALEFEQLLYRSLRGRVDAPFRKGKRGRIAEHVYVAIARAARDSEIDRGAAGGGNRGSRPHHPGGASGGTRPAQHCASCQHGVVLPMFGRRIGWRASPRKDADRLSPPRYRAPAAQLIVSVAIE